MKEIFSFSNSTYLKKYLGFTLEDVDSAIKGIESNLDVNPISVVFVNKSKIKQLNKEYRNIDNVTDILSFNIDAPELLGELYICPEYVKDTIETLKYREEFLRLLIHGTLHLMGYDHSVEFREQDFADEEMYQIQEKILKSVI